MSTVNRLKIDYTTTGGETRSISYNRVSSSLSVGIVRAICTALVENGSILVYPPSEIVGASLVTTTESEYDL